MPYACEDILSMLCCWAAPSMLADKNKKLKSKRIIEEV